MQFNLQKHAEEIALRARQGDEANDTKLAAVDAQLTSAESEAERQRKHEAEMQAREPKPAKAA